MRFVAIERPGLLKSQQEAALDAVVVVRTLVETHSPQDGRLLEDSPFDGLSEIGSIIHRRAILFLGRDESPNWSVSFRIELPTLRIATNAPVPGGSG